MHPILIKLGPITIHTYGFLLAVGVLIAIIMIQILGKKENIDREVLTNFIFYTFLIALLGAKLFLFVTEIKFYLSNPAEIKNLITSAGVFYGGLICGGLFATWYIKKHKLVFRQLTDIIVPAVALGHFFGRLGCFAAGCCWGREAEGCSIAVQFTDSRATTGVPLHTHLYPTQLIEAILNLLNFAVLFILYKKKKFAGQVFAVYIFNYSLIRFCIEYFRGDPDRGYIFGGMHHPFVSLSVPQLISIIGFFLAIILYRVFKKKAAAENLGAG
jgi:phosphatidylglycerol:prolipoprotein diacylglycerol transferase